MQSQSDFRIFVWLQKLCLLSRMNCNIISFYENKHVINTWPGNNLPEITLKNILNLGKIIEKPSAAKLRQTCYSAIHNNQ